jgi:hypothetical protein
MNYKDRLKRYNEDRKRRNRRASGSGATAPDLYLTDPANPASVLYDSYTSESSDSSYASRSEPERPSYDYGSSSSSYDSGSSSSSYDSGSSSGGGSYGE